MYYGVKKVFINKTSYLQQQNSIYFNNLIALPVVWIV